MPCADFGLLAVLKRSPEYREVRNRGAISIPVDAWQLDMTHYFLFEISPAENGVVSFALFTMQWEYDAPLAALIIRPSDNGESAEVTNLRQSESVYTASLA